jgi:Family of unknown function (DUF6167)
MKRLFYLAVGVGIGVAAVRKASRAAQKLTPSGLAGSAGDAVSGVGGAVRTFVNDVRANMAERELQLHEALTGDTGESSRPDAPGNRNGRSTV